MLSGKKENVGPDNEAESIVSAISTLKENTVRRGLKDRHLSMMALGGVIGPGLLVGTGQALVNGGPAALLIGFIAIGFVAFSVMQSLGELVTLFPTGGAFVTLGSRFVNKPLGFIIGWNYFIIWVAVLANEYNAISTVMVAWSDKVPIYGYFLLFWVFFTVFQMLGVETFGEAEYWLALLKIIGLLAFFLFSIVYVSGGVKGHPAFGFHYWNDPGAFSNGFRGVAKVFIFCSTFYAGTESVTMAASESKNPHRAIPRAIRQVIWRILFVYIGSALSFGMTCPWNAPQLNSRKTKALQSPMTIAIQNAGWQSGYHLINAFLLVTCLSAINSSIYIGSRTVFHMASEGIAPAFLGRTFRSTGLPVAAILFTNAFGFLSLMNISTGAAKAYTYIVNLSGVSTFVVWGCVSLIHLRFRAAWRAQGHGKEELPFSSLFYPWNPIFGLVFNVFLLLVQGWTTLSPFSAADFVDAYILLPVSVLGYFAYGLYHCQLKWRNLLTIDLYEGQLKDSGDRKEKDEEERTGLFDQSEIGKSTVRVTHKFAVDSSNKFI